MGRETRDVYYMVLDLLESIKKTSQESGFIKVDENVLNEVKNEIYRNLDRTQTEFQMKDKKTELIGILPSVLIDSKKFSKNEDIVKLTEQSLNITIPNWKKRSRNEIIGTVIAEIAKKNVRDLDLFFDAWEEFTKFEPQKKLVERKDFVDVWLTFFNQYRELK